MKFIEMVSSKLDFLIEKIQFTQQLLKKLSQNQIDFIYQLSQPRKQIINLLLLMINKQQITNCLNSFTDNQISFKGKEISSVKSQLFKEKLQNTIKKMTQQQIRISHNIQQLHRDLFYGKLHRVLDETFGSREPYLISILRSPEKLKNVPNYYDELRNFLINYGIPSYFNFTQQSLQTQCFRLILQIDLVCLKQKKYPTQPPYSKQSFIKQVEEIGQMLFHQAQSKVNQLKRQLLKMHTRNQQILLQQTSEKIAEIQKSKFLRYVGDRKQVVYDVNEMLTSGPNFDTFSGHFVEEKAIEVTVKVIKKMYSKFRKSLIEYEKQFDLMKKINHPNIVAFYFYHNDQNNINIVTEKYDITLEDLLYEQKKLKENRIFKYSLEIIAAINYLHKSQIIHRDLKPQNILIKNDEIKIVDFGISREVDQEDINNGMELTVVGTPYYMAPQLINALQDDNSTSKYTSKCDIWSIGCIIYEMLTGERLFQKNIIKQQKQDYQTKIKQNCKDKNKFWEKVLIEYMLVYEEKYRVNTPQLMELFGTELKNFILDEKQNQALTQLISKSPITAFQKQKYTSQRLQLMLDYLYNKINLSYNILGLIQHTQVLKSYLSQYLNWVLQFILLNWNRLQLKYFLSTLVQQSINFQDKQFIFEKNEAKKKLMNKRKTLIDEIQIGIKQRQSLLQSYYEYLMNAKFSEDKNKLKKKNPKIESSINFYKVIQDPKLYNQILDEFLRSYGIPTINNQAQLNKQQEIWKCIASLFLLNVKQTRYPLKKPYEKRIYQNQFTMITTMDTAKAKAFVKQITKGLQIQEITNNKIFYNKQNPGITIIKRIPSPTQIKKYIQKPKVQILTIYDRIFKLMEFKYHKLKIVYSYTYYFQQNFSTLVDPFYYCLLLFLVLLWNKMEIFEFIQQFGQQTILFEKQELKMEITDENEIFLNKRNNLLNMLIQKSGKINGYMKEFVTFLNKPIYSVIKTSTQKSYPELTEIIQKYQTIQIQSKIINKIFKYYFSPHYLNIKTIQKLIPQQKFKKYRIIAILIFLISMEKFITTSSYDKSILENKIEQMEFMKIAQVKTFIQKNKIEND